MTTIKLKRNTTAGVAPSASDLEVGEIAINTADGKLYVKHTDNSINTVQGDKGQKGEVGSTGSQGAKGQKGEVGASGSAGSAGSKGQKGEVGSSGAAGDKGQKGEVGNTGNAGSDGSAGQKGQKGQQGNFGGATFSYGFNTNTSNTDPTAGKVSFNNATVSSVTQIYIDDADSGSTDIQSFLRTIDDSTSTIKGHVRFSNATDASDFAIFTIASISEQSGYFVINVSHVDGSASSFTNGEDLTVTFARTGDVGDKGQKGEAGASGSAGSAGLEGDKGQKGQKGEVGAAGSSGNDGSKGQKGEVGVQGSGGSTGQKGQKGEVGVQGGTGGTGQKGQKGEVGATGNPFGGGTFTGDVTFDNNDELRFGTGTGQGFDFRVYWDDTNSKAIIQSPTNESWPLQVRMNGGLQVGNHSNSQFALHAVPGGAVTLYHNASAKLTTSSSGCTISGTLAATAVTGDGSGLTNLPAQSDNTKMPLSGGTFTGDVTFDGDGGNIVFDKSHDAFRFYPAAAVLFVNSAGTNRSQIMYDNTRTTWTNISDYPIRIDGSFEVISGSSSIASFETTGVDLYFSNSKKFETTSSGCTVSGTLAATAITGDGSGLTNVSASDSSKMPLAGGTFTGDVTFDGDAGNIVFDKSHDAFRFYPAAAVLFVNSAGTNRSQIMYDNTRTTWTNISDYPIRIDGSFEVVSGSSSIASFETTGVDLYYSNSKKFETTTLGVNIIGTLTSDGLTVDGVSTLTSNSSGDGILLNGRSDNISQFTFRSNDGATNYSQLQSRSTEMFVKTLANIPMSFHTNNTERMRIDSSGHVGIGRSNPLHPLHIGDTSGNTVLELQRTNTNTTGSVGAISFTASDDHSVAAIHASGDGDNEGADLIFRTTSAASENNYFNSTSERMRIDSNGRVGITAAPKFSAVFKALELGPTALVSPNNTNGRMVTNLYYDGSYKRKTNGVSLQYEQDNAGHIWYFDASGTADAAFTQSERMRLDASGNLGIGTSSPAEKLDIAGSAVVSNGGFYKFGDGTVRIYGETSSDIMTFVTNNSEAMRITSSGLVGIGTANPTRRLEVQQNASDDIATFINADTTNGYGVNIKGGGTASGRYVLRLADGSDNVRVLVQADGNVGIGTSSPSQQLTLANSSSSKINIKGHSASAGFFIGMDAATSTQVWNAENGYMRFATNDTERMRLDASGNLGIGTTPSTTFHVKTGTNQNFNVFGPNVFSNGVTLASTTDGFGAYVEMEQRATQFAWHNGTTERLRLDASGKLLVGKTSSNYAAEGVEIRPNEILITKAGTNPLSVRNNGNGGLISLNSAGTTIGSIGSYGSGSGMYLGTGDTGIAFNSTDENVFPRNPSTNLPRDNAIDLGSSIARFKDAYFSGTVNAANFNTTSDATLKTNVETLTGSLDAVKALRGVSYDWIENGNSEVGVIAQEVEEVIPDVVSTNDQGIKSVKYGNLVGVLIEAIKEQQERIEALEARLGD